MARRAGSSGLQQRLTLAPSPHSARAARGFVGHVLSAAHAERFADLAELLTSELVTNGIVHAHTDLQVLVEATPQWVRVEVGDGDPRLPARREYGDQAMTGRGLEMVELLSDDFGVESLDDDGKRVWFRLGVAPGTPYPAEPVVEHAAPRTTRVELVGLPVALYCIWQQHADALLREATWLAFRDGDVEGPGDYPLASRALAALAEAAVEVFALRGEDVASVDLPLEVDTSAVPWFPILRDVLARATAMSRGGHLLVPPTLPELVALRNWICDEVARQSAGLRPTPWSGAGDEESPPVAIAAETLAEIRSSSDVLVAADAGNRIVAASPSAEDLLGWAPGELDGRRLVAIIPPRLRDRHVAGFTRHLLEGSSHIIGRDVPVPALRKDGSEVAVLLRIEQRSGEASRGLFVATLTPRP